MPHTLGNAGEWEEIKCHRWAGVLVSTQQRTRSVDWEARGIALHQTYQRTTLSVCQHVNRHWGPELGRVAAKTARHRCMQGIIRKRQLLREPEYSLPVLCNRTFWDDRNNLYLHSPKQWQFIPCYILMAHPDLAVYARTGESEMRKWDWTEPSNQLGIPNPPCRKQIVLKRPIRSVKHLCQPIKNVWSATVWNWNPIWGALGF